MRVALNAQAAGTCITVGIAQCDPTQCQKVLPTGFGGFGVKIAYIVK